MKKILMVILMMVIVSPTFAYADNDKSSRKGDNDSRKSAQAIQKNEKKEIKKEIKEIKKEVKEIKKEFKNEIKSHKRNNDDDDEDEDDKRKHYYATTTPVIIATSTATTSPYVNISKKINYYLCKTDTGWNVVSLEGVKNKNSARALGKYCMKLPHGFMKKFNGTTATTTPDVLAPVITLATATGVTSTGATISWTTNELANGNIYVSATSPVNLSTATTLGTTTLSTLHSFNLTGLTASTTYYYVVKSADASNNVATSSQMSFVTPSIADTTAPVISGIAGSAIASTTATVSWNTNELATGKLWYGTSTPLTLYMQNTTPSIAHSFNLIGLTASTTYNLLIESTDNASNTATSTTSLVTTN